MKPAFILAIDQGTTSSRAILFNRNGRIHGMAQREFTQFFPHSGWVEHDANEIWTSQLAVAQQVLSEHQLNASDIAAIGITNQRETTVLWDRATGEPIAPAIVWQDRRSAGLCDNLREAGHSELFQQKTGLVIDAYFSATKLRWLLDHVPGARARAEQGELAFGTVDSWLTFKLADVHLTDTSNASRTMLFNIHTLEWDQQLLDLLQIPKAVLPKVVASSGVAAHTHAHFFGAPIAIAGIAGDQQAATFGQACFAEGMVKSTFGTGCFILMNTGQAKTSHTQLLSTVGWSLGAGHQSKTAYLLEGGVFMGGATVQWLRDGLKLIKHSSEVEALAASVPDSDDVTFVPAFSGLGAPHWDAYARGSMLGITRGTQAGHIARAALEGIAFQTADVIRAMQVDAGTPILELRVDGGAASNNLLMQFQADVLGVPVVRPVVTETTALGAAYLAGLGVGFWADQNEIASQWQIEHRFEPVMSVSEREARLAVWARAISRASDWARPGDWSH
jgi:glycerol kinase